MSVRNNSSFAEDVEAVETLQRELGDTAFQLMNTSIKALTDEAFILTVDDELAQQLDYDFGEFRREENKLLDEQYWGADAPTMR